MVEHKLEKGDTLKEDWEEARRRGRGCVYVCVCWGLVGAIIYEGSFPAAEGEGTGQIFQSSYKLPAVQKMADHSLNGQCCSLCFEKAQIRIALLLYRF